MDIYEILRNDYSRIRDLIASIEAEKSPVRSKELLAQLQKKLLPHMKAEEHVLYSSLIKRDPAFSDNVKILHHEQVQIAHLLQQLQAMDINRKWHILFTQLKSVVEIYIDREQMEMFSVAQSNFSQEEAEELAHLFYKKIKGGSNA